MTTTLVLSIFGYIHLDNQKIFYKMIARYFDYIDQDCCTKYLSDELNKDYNNQLYDFYTKKE